MRSKPTVKQGQESHRQLADASHDDRRAQGDHYEPNVSEDDVGRYVQFVCANERVDYWTKPIKGHDNSNSCC